MRGIRWLVLGCVVLAFAADVVRADLAADLAALLRKGLYDEVILQASNQIERTEEPDKALLYLRGQAAFRIGRFALAAADLGQLGDYKPWDKWTPASEYAARVAEMLRLCPRLVHEITQRGGVVFRVYFEEDHPWAAAIMATLPEAYTRVCQFYGVTLAETPVFIFSTGPRYNAFYRAFSGGRPPTGWQWATGGGGLLMFCQHDVDGTQPAATGSDYFRAAIAHEFSHCLLRRYLGAMALPPWLDEGLAMLCGAFMSPGDHDNNDATIAEVLRGAGPLPIEVLSEKERFYRSDVHQTAYAIGFSMTRLLYERIGRAGLMRLLNALRQEGDVDRALRQVCGLDSRQLHAVWVEAALARVSGR